MPDLVNEGFVSMLRACACLCLCLCLCLCAYACACAYACVRVFMYVCMWFVCMCTDMLFCFRRCFNRHKKDYARLSQTPDKFEEFSNAVTAMMETQPNYSAQTLSQITGLRVAIVHSEHDEFIKREHAEYLARTIPNAMFISMAGVSHFAPLQQPERFNDVLISFLRK